MGIAIPQVITPDRATGAQVIDGSLRFSGTDQKLERTPGSAGNQKTWTWSSWVKIQPDQMNSVFSVHTGASDRLHLRIGNSYAILAQNTGSWDFDIRSNAVFRDSGWYHLVCVADFTNSTQNDRAILYVNGERLTLGTNTLPSNTTTNTIVNATKAHYIGESRSGTDFEGRMSQVYFIDGEALGPENFGFTDPLTNTWKPKKYTGAFTRSSFNDGTNWTSSLSATSGTLSNGANAFDGDLSTRAQTVSAAAGKELTFAPPAINFTTSLEVYCDQGSAVPTATWNGNTVNPGGGAWVTVYSGSGELSSTYPLVINTETAAQYATLKGVRIDGEILIDNLNNSGANSFYLPFDGNSPIGEDKSGQGNNFTPVNFGGSVELDKATGAKPILNTVGGATATVGVFGSRQNIGYAVTVYNSGGGNKYYLDGVETPTLTGLIRGATYTFDQTDSSNSTHPLVFGTTANGNNYGIGVSITGSPGSTGITSITIPHNAPDTLYYHCSAHSGMGGSITGITTNEKLADPYASNCVLALSLAGIATDISPSIACTSHRKNIASSVVSGSSTANFYSNSMRWSATTSSVAASEQGDELIFGTGDFTIECWVYDDNGHNGNSSRCYIFDNRSGGSVAGDPPQIVAYVDTHSEWNVYIGNPVVEIVKEVGTGAILNQWNHFAVTREGSTVRMFVNGVLLGTATSSTDFTNNGIGIGRGYDSGYGWSGNIQDFRVYKGVAKYTSDFIPASPKPDILPDTPSGVSGSSKLTKITDGSVSFTGIGVTHLSLADNADFTMGSGDWTMECFAFPQTPQTAHYGSLIQKYATTGSDSSWFWSVYQFTTGYATHNFYFYRSDGTQFAYTAATKQIPLDQWHHFVATRDGDTIRLYIDGVQDGTIDVTGESMNDTTCDLTIGADSSNNYAMEGSISNARVIKGTCLYPDGKSFTPPRAPLTTTSQGATASEVKLLCCQSPTQAGAAVTAHTMGGVNNGTQWSHYLTTTQGSHSRDFYTSGYDAVNMFNGSTSNFAYGGWIDDSDDASDLVFNPPDGIVVSSKLEVYVGYYDKIKVNGSTYNTGGESTNLAWVTVSDGTNFTGTINELILENTTNANVVRCAAIRIDDTTILRDPLTPEGGNTRTFAATNFSPFNTDIHAVRGQETGYATWNPLFNNTRTGGNGTISDGNLYVAQSTHGVVLGNTLMTSGKWYFEAYIENGNMMIGVMGEDWSGADTQSYNWDKAYGIYPAAPYFVQGGSFLSKPRPNTGTVSGYGALYGVAVDIDNRKMWLHKDGRWVHNNPVSTIADVTLDANSPGFFAWFHSAASDGNNCTANFGQKPFKFPPPDGYQPLNAANTRPETVISRPDQYVGMTTYTGNNTVGRKIDIGRQADLIWVKKFAPDGENHILVDTVRGANNFLIPDSADEINTSGGPITGLGSTVPNGFIVDNNGYVNASSSHYICWNWKAGGDKGTFNVDDIGYATAAAAGLNGGTITPTGASVGTKQGFSIIKYTANLTQGATVSHGLTQKPDFAIFKNMDSNLGTNEVDWGVYHTSIGATKKLELNQNLAAEDHPGPFNDTEPTSSLFTFGGSPDAFGHSYMTNGPSGDDFIAYIWHDVPGLQKFGMYINNKNTDGPYVELGFKPALFVIKRTDSTGNWWVYNVERNPTNLTTSNVLRWDEPNAETSASTSYSVDFLSNGFKIRSQTADLNYDTGFASTYVYAAWAAAPSVDLFGGGANAR